MTSGTKKVLVVLGGLTGLTLLFRWLRGTAYADDTVSLPPASLPPASVTTVSAQPPTANAAIAKAMDNKGNVALHPPAPNPGKLTLNFLLGVPPGTTYSNANIAAMATDAIAAINRCGPIQVLNGKVSTAGGIAISAVSYRIVLVYDATFPSTFPSVAPLSPKGTACMAAALAAVFGSVSNVVANGQLHQA